MWNEKTFATNSTTATFLYPESQKLASPRLFHIDIDLVKEKKLERNLKKSESSNPEICICMGSRKAFQITKQLTVGSFQNLFVYILYKKVIKNCKIELKETGKGEVF